MVHAKGYYKVLIHKDLQKCIDKRKPPFNIPFLLKAFETKVEYLREDCSHPSLNFKPYKVSDKTKKQIGVTDIYEFYINMSIRCLVYVLDNERELILYNVGNHKETKQKAK